MLEADDIKHSVKKEKTQKGYFRRVRKILKSKPDLSYRSGIISCTKDSPAKRCIASILKVFLNR